MDMLDLTTRYAEAINSRDLDEVEALLHPDIVYTANAAVGAMEGTDAVMLYFEALIEAGVHVGVTQQHVAEPYVLTEFHVTERRGDGLVATKDVLVRQLWDDGLLLEHRGFADRPQLRDHIVD